MIFYTTEKSLSDTKSKLVELFDLEIRNVKNTEPSSWLKASINYEWPKITKILYRTIINNFLSNINNIISRI